MLRSEREVDCTACGKCMEVCPRNIPIADYFDLYNDHCRMHRYSNGMVYYGVFPAESGKASDCIGCGKCEGVCPQKLPVQQYLKDVADAFENSSL